MPAVRMGHWCLSLRGLCSDCGAEPLPGSAGKGTGAAARHTWLARGGQGGELFRDAKGVELEAN